MALGPLAQNFVQPRAICVRHRLDLPLTSIVLSLKLLHRRILSLSFRYTEFDADSKLGKLATLATH